MGEAIEIDLPEMRTHAQWWAAEGLRAQQRTATDPGALEAARTGFGKIGSSSVGAALAEVLAARDAAGKQLGRDAEAIAERIRRSVDHYQRTEDDNRRDLAGDGTGTSGDHGHPLPPYPYPQGGPTDPAPPTFTPPAPAGELPPYPYPQGGPHIPTDSSQAPSQPGDLPSYPYPDRGPFTQPTPGSTATDDDALPGQTTPANR